MNRPTITPDMIAEAAKKLAAGNGWDTDQADDVAKAYRYPMDGYELAKALELRCAWDITMSDVDALDCMDTEVRELHRAAIKEWVREHNIQPPLPVGTMTTQGEIMGIYDPGTACYLIRAIGETNESRRLIVRFEDARAAGVGGANQ